MTGSSNQKVSATVDEGLVVVLPVGHSERLLCHGIAGFIRMMSDLSLQPGKSSVFSITPKEESLPTRETHKVHSN